MTDENSTPDSGPPDDRRSEQAQPPKPDAPQERLSADEAAQLVARVAELAKTGLPLPGGLRAAAAELPRGKLPRAMIAVAASLERGQSLDQALSAQHGRFPPHLRGLVAAGARSGKLGEVLEQFVQFRQFRADIRRGVWLAIGYPLLLLAILAGLLIFLLNDFIPFIAEMEHEFKTDMPVSELLGLLNLISQNERACVGVLLTVVLVAIVAGWFAGAAIRRRILNRLPLFGAIWRFSGLAEFSRLLRLLIGRGIPLPEALRLTADGIGDADLASGSRHLAERVETGQPLSSGMTGLPQFTPLLRSLLEWGETHAALPAALDTAAQLSVRRVEARTEMLRWIVPPAVVLLIFACVDSVFRSFTSLITSLSSYYYLTSGKGPVVANWDVYALGGVIAIGALGIAVFAWLRLVGTRRPARETLCSLATIFAVVLLAISIIGLFALAVGGHGFVLGVFALVAWGAAAFRFRQSQRAALLDLLSAAVGRGMPLEPLVRAFAAEQTGRIGRRATWLADWLAAGWPLADAVRVDGRLLTSQAILAVEVGEETGSLPATLPEARESSATSVRNWGGTAIGVLSLWSIVTTGMVGGGFLLLKVAPAYAKIYRDFHAKLPDLTVRAFAFLGSPPVEFLMGATILFLIVATFYVSLYAMGLRMLGLPFVDRLLAPLDAAVVLRCLGVAANRGQPLEPTLNLLAIRYPKWLIRRRLRRAATVMGVGGDWVAALRSQRLIRRTDAAILRAAAQAGNLGWALSEAAASGERLVVYRLQWLSQIFAPLLVLAAGIAVGLFAIAMLMPLAELIRGLAK